MNENTGDITRSIDQIIYSSCVKYDRLQYLVYRTFSDTSIAKATTLNVFVDLYSVLKSVFSEHGHTDLSLGNYTDITVGLVNMCAHYRSFFKSIGVYTKFYMVFSLNTGEYYTKFVKDYNAKFRAKSEVKQFVDVVASNFQLLELITPYLPDIHFVYTKENYESTVLMAYLINKINDGNPNLILSKDIYPMQLCASFPYTSYLHPKKIKGGGDASMMITINEKKESFRKDFWDLLISERLGNFTSIETLYKLSPVNFPLLCAMNRFTDRNLYAVININQSVDAIYNVVEDADIRLTIDTLLMSGKISEALIRTIEPRLYCLDYNYAYPYYANSPEVLNINLNNLQDNGKLENINSKYFANNPMKLLYL